MSHNETEVAGTVSAIEGKLKRHFGKTTDTATKEQIYQAVALCVRDEMIDNWVPAKEKIKKEGYKKLLYMSAEFLMGRALLNNMVNLKMTDKYNAALEKLGLKLAEIEEVENDAALGNGGLGRLAACFLDSLATLKLPAMGCGIRYQHGIFRQRILDGEQVELEDNWVETGYVWEIEKDEEAVEIRFGGELEEYWDNNGLQINHFNYHSVLALPYDMPIVGYDSDAPATLRLWSARAKQNLDMSFFNRGDYLRATEEKELAEVISKVLYPEDNHDAGKQLRLKQFYFFTSATMQHIVREHKKLRGDLHTLPDYYEVQINDTHPTLAIPELLRILLDEERFTWDEAYDVVSRMFNYTNHTVLAEALERWPKDMLSLMLPRIAQIIEVINEKYCARLWETFPGEFEKISQLAISAYNEIRMANLCVAVCKKVNGVSALHAKILKTSVFRAQYVMNKSKFLGITNGITHRRWLAKANPALTSLLTEYIGEQFLSDYREFEKIAPLADDPEFRKKFGIVKAQNKKRYAEHLYLKQGILVNPEAIFDVHAKRLHEYKRQLLKVLQIMHLYNYIIDNPGKYNEPIVFMFAAKASPGYARAKKIIQLINAVAELVNNDERVNKIMQVVYIENYCVSEAELLTPATDISEQISTAGKEASGTGNMKFMMNGAVTLGTLDGANVEIAEQVGRENIYIFGATVEEINYMNRFNSYHPGKYYEKDAQLRRILNQLIDGTLNVPEHQFSDIYHSLLFGDSNVPDQYFLLYDFEPYIHAFFKAVVSYSKRDKWLKKAVINTAKSGYFSSDRTIEEYNEKIWHLTPLS